MLFVIEHLEPKLSDWLYIEYSHAARIVGRKGLLITKVRKKADFKKLSRIARVERRRATELFKDQEIVVLDPSARKVLTPKDLANRKAVLLGGILGNDPPLGRTRELLTKSLPRALVRNIGKHQFSIDGSAFVAKQISIGKSMDKIPVQHGLEIEINKVYSVALPYAFPLVEGKPLISRELVSYLKRH